MAFMNSGEYFVTNTHEEEDDEDLLNQDNQANEIESLIYKQNLQILDERYSNYQQKHLELSLKQSLKLNINETQGYKVQKNKIFLRDSGREVDETHFEEVKNNPLVGIESQPVMNASDKESGKDSNEFEFEQFMKEHQFQLNHKLDSERSQFTQESYSDPEISARDNNLMSHPSRLGMKTYESNVQKLRQILRQKELNEQNQKIDTSLSKIISDMQDGENESEEGRKSHKDLLLQYNPSQQYTGSFSMIGNSPGKDSLQGSFQGQITSNFPQNLKDTQLYRLRDNSLMSSGGNPQLLESLLNTGKQSDDNEERILDQNKNEMNDKSESINEILNPSTAVGAGINKSSSANSSFYKFEGKKIKDFEKSTIIKFEEFEGEALNSERLESDPNPKLSERISDRIYERSDPGLNNQHTQRDDHLDHYFQSYDSNNNNTNQNPIMIQNQYQEHQNEDSGFLNLGSHQASQQLSPIDQDKKQLYVITEESVSEDVQSSFNAYNRLPSVDPNHNSNQSNNQERLQIASEFTRSQGQQDSTSREYTYQKSKSQPLHKNGRYSINKSSTTEKRDDRMKTDFSPTKQSSQPLYTSQSQPFNPNVSNPEKAIRLSPHDSPFQGNDQDQMNQYFQRHGHSNHNLRLSHNNPNHINTSQPDFLVSEEDLLSNVDRISKILPANEISEDDFERKEPDEITLHQKLKESKQLVDHLRCEIQNKNTLLMIKDSQLNLLQMKNEELEEQILKVKNELEEMQLPSFNKKTITKDAETQVNEFERKKIREKKKFSTGMKKTPTRVNQDMYQDYSDITAYLKVGGTNQFDTPLLKNDLSFKESPTTSKKGGKLSKQQSISFGSEDFTQFRIQIQQLKNQLIKSEENNLNLQQKIEKYKSDKNTLKERYFAINSEKNEFKHRFDKFQKEIEQSMMKIEGLKAENLDYRRQIDLYQLKYENAMYKVEQGTNTVSMSFQDQICQTDFIYQTAKLSDNQLFLKQPYSAFKNPSLPKRGEILILDDKFDDKDAESTFSSKSMNNQNITIINSNKQDLNMLLEKAKDYELISQKLQNEINQHRRLLKENQVKIQQDLDQQKDYKRKIKKRDLQIEKYRQRIKQVEAENLELKMKVEEFNQKIQDIRIKMEAKVQEKEFKIISLKNQMKHFSMSSGLLTPATTNVNGRILNQNDLYSVINSIIQQQIQQQSSLLNLSNKGRAKSQEQPFQTTVGASFYDENLLDEPKIMTPNHVMLGENPSFCNYDNQTTNTIFFSNPNEKIYSTPSVQQVSVNKSQYKNFATNNNALSGTLKDSQHLQHIFSSSMKRIQEELESIKDFNSSGNIQLKNIIRNNQQVQQSIHQSAAKVFTENGNRPSSFHQTPSMSNENLNFHPVNPVTYEDSLQSQDRRHARQKQQYFHSIPDTLVHDASSEISSHVDQKIEQMRLKRLLDQQNQRFINKAYPIKGIENIDAASRRNTSLQNTHTFRQASTQGKNSPKKNLQQQFEVNEQPVFNQTQGFNVNDKEQNASIFYDFKPQFDNSNISNISGLFNQTQTRIRNMQASKDQSAVKFESKKPSLNSSIKNPISFQQHIRLNSNMRRQTEIEESSDEFDSCSKDSYRRKFKSISDQNQLRGQTHYSAIIKYDEMLPPKQNANVPPRSKNSYSSQTKAKRQQIAQQQAAQQNLQEQLIAQRVKNSPTVIDGSRSTLSNYSQKLDDLKKKYGRAN